MCFTVKFVFVFILIACFLYFKVDKFIKILYNLFKIIGKIMVENKQILREFFEFSLSCSAAKTGIRLKSEPELSKMLGVGRQRIRGVINDLVERGFLSRKHGSGTFVRKAYSGELKNDPEYFIKPFGVIPDAVFEADPSRSTICPDEEMQRLRIGVQVDHAVDNGVNYCLFQFLCEKIEAAGHYPVKYYGREERHKTVKEYATYLLELGCDGFLHNIMKPKSFQQALAEAYPKQHMPVNYIASGQNDLCMQSVALMDVYESISRGTRILLEKGYEKIALIMRPGWGSEYPAPINIFLQTLNNNHVNHYHESILINTNVTPDFSVALNLSLDALFIRNQPDALLVMDDHFLPGTRDFLREKGFKVGKDIGVLALTNKCLPSNDDVDWSRLELDPQLLAEAAVRNILDMIMNNDGVSRVYCQVASWIPGNTLRF